MSVASPARPSLGGGGGGKRHVSPGMAARMAMFNSGDQQQPDSGGRKDASKGSRSGTPRRSVSPRLRERVDSFSRTRDVSKEDVSKDAPIVRGVNDAQISQVVSGALDRLRQENDPCVRYDLERKLWIYLHGSRTEDELNKPPPSRFEPVLARQ